VSLPSAVGSFAVAAAASGVVTMPQAFSVSSAVSDDPTAAAADRPQAAGTVGALDTVVAAGESLTAESTQTAKDAHAALVEAERQRAAERAARAEREGKLWVLPLEKYRVTATFGSVGRLWSSRHTGIDLSAAYGTPVKSLSSGEIIETGYEGPYGNRVIIRHWDGTETWYCHLSQIEQRSGKVMPGTVIGNVGSTGNSTGPHLHLEVHPDGGDPVNPRSWLAEHGVDI
jgi:murein DD-endopeptidase MepM/ murein hydrolase activator NlpD